MKESEIKYQKKAGVFHFYRNTHKLGWINGIPELYSASQLKILLTKCNNGMLHKRRIQHPEFTWYIEFIMVLTVSLVFTWIFMYVANDVISQSLLILIDIINPIKVLFGNSYKCNIFV